MKTPHDLALELESEFALMPVEFRLEYIRSALIPLLEGTGYDLARQADSETTASLFILVAEMDKRLQAIRDKIGSTIHPA